MNTAQRCSLHFGHGVGRSNAAAASPRRRAVRFSRDGVGYGKAVRAATFPRIVSSTLAGTFGFLLGFYAGLFLVLSIWDLEAGQLQYVALTVGIGSLVAGSAVALTVEKQRRATAMVTALGLGLALAAISLILDLDPPWIWGGGLLLAGTTALLARADATEMQ